MFVCIFSDPAAGASDDWYKGGLGVRYAFTTELRYNNLFWLIHPTTYLGALPKKDPDNNAATSCILIFQMDIFSWNWFFILFDYCRDTGNYGFELPANQIIPSGEEYVAGMRVIFEKIISDNADISQI